MAASLPAGCAKSLTCPGNPPVQEKRPALRNKGKAAEKPAETDCDQRPGLVAYPAVSVVIRRSQVPLEEVVLCRN